MGGQFGVGEAVKVAQALASLINVGYKLVKGNFFAVFELAGTFNILQGVNLTEFKSEVLELDAGEREQVEQAFAMKLDLADKAIQQKLIESGDALNQAASVVEEAVQVFEDAKSVVERFRAILGV